MRAKPPSIRKIVLTRLSKRDRWLKTQAVGGRSALLLSLVASGLVECRERDRHSSYYEWRITDKGRLHTALGRF